MTFCRFCGNRIHDDSVFCGTCGKHLTFPSDTPTSNATPPQNISARPSTGSTMPVRQSGVSRQQTTETTISDKSPEQAQNFSQTGQRRSGEFTPLPPVAPAASGPTSNLAGTPQVSHVPSLSGTPQMHSVPSIHGTPQGAGAPSISSPTHADVIHGKTVSNNQGSAHNVGHTPSQSHASEIARQRLPQMRRWGFRRAIQHGVTHGTTSGTAGATTVGVGAAVKAIIAIAVIAAASAGAVKAAPLLFHHGGTTPSSSHQIATQPMPPTSTSCPAPGTARAMVNRTLVPGNHQNLVFSTGTNLERYDASTGHTTTILAAVSPGEAQISADGTWLLFVSSVGGQTAIQLIRMDGQGLQTLHCAAAGQNIFNLIWSPNQQLLAFDEGVSIVGTPSGAANTELLQMKTGKLQTLLIQPPYVNSQQNQLGYLPFYWTDNTHLYLEDFIRCCVGDYPPTTVYQLDLSLGDNQHPADLRTTAQFGGNAAAGITLSPDHSKLFISSCNCGFGTYTGPSPLVEQSSAGGTAGTFYTDANDAITGLATIDSNNLLLSIVNIQGDTSQNGIWRLNLATHQKTRVISAPSVAAGGFLMILFNGATFYPWDNVSRDGSLFAVHFQSDAATSSYATASLFIGSLQGKATATNFYTGSPFDRTGTTQPQAAIVGWTTM